MERFVSYRRRALVILAVLAVAAALPVGSVWAEANFHGTVTITLDTSGADICDLTASGIDESGLGFANVTYVLSADAKLGKACQNNGGNFPSDPKKQGSAGAIQGEQTVQVKNGRVRGASVTVDIDDPTTGIPVALSCPGGQKPVVVCCSYANIALTDTTSSPTVDATVSTTSASFTLAGAPASTTALCQ